MMINRQERASELLRVLKGLRDEQQRIHMEYEADRDPMKHYEQIASLNTRMVDAVVKVVEELARGEERPQIGFGLCGEG